MRATQYFIDESSHYEGAFFPEPSREVDFKVNITSTSSLTPVPGFYGFRPAPVRPWSMTSTKSTVDSWANKTPDEILADFNDLLVDTWDTWGWSAAQLNMRQAYLARFMIPIRWAYTEGARSRLRTGETVYITNATRQP